ncbi:hypothetical protein BDW22DRAFT_1361925 [Trametopsis cervina]|nr:hypothetical protein BDW22DRAFT_1361925 [Trametopsis cervina]
MPHRGTPFGTAGFPALANLTQLRLSRLHFARFSDLVMLTDVPLHWPPRSVHRKCNTGIKSIFLTNCTDNPLGAIAAHTLDARLPVQTLTSHERLQVQHLFQALRADGPRVLEIRLVPAPFLSERLGNLLLTCSHPELYTKPQVIGALLVLPLMKGRRKPKIDALHNFLESIIAFPGLRAIGVAYEGVPDEHFFSLSKGVDFISQLRPDVICRALCLRPQNAPKHKEWVEYEWLTNEPTGRVWKCDKKEDKEHSHAYTACGDALFARAMTSAVEEHMRKTHFAPYAETQVVA